MKTNRDLYAIISVVLWLFSNVLSFIFIGDCLIINSLFIIFWIITLYFDKRNNKENKFHIWLNQKIK